jgi:hypothetical protein
LLFWKSEIVAKTSKIDGRRQLLKTDSGGSEYRACLIKSLGCPYRLQSCERERVNKPAQLKAASFLTFVEIGKDLEVCVRIG